MKNSIHIKTIETKYQAISPKKNTIKSIKKGKWLSKTTIGNGDFDIKYGNRKLTLASTNVATLKKHDIIEKQNTRNSIN